MSEVVPIRLDENVVACLEFIAWDFTRDIRLSDGGVRWHHNVGRRFDRDREIVRVSFCSALAPQFCDLGLNRSKHREGRAARCTGWNSLVQLYDVPSQFGNDCGLVGRSISEGDLYFLLDSHIRRVRQGETVCAGTGRRSQSRRLVCNIVGDRHDITDPESVVTVYRNDSGTRRHFGSAFHDIPIADLDRCVTRSPRSLEPSAGRVVLRLAPDAVVETIALFVVGQKSFASQDDVANIAG